MSGFFGNVFNLLCFAVILSIVPTIAHKYQLSEINRKTLLEVLILILLGFITWGSVFITPYKRRLLAWLVFLIYFGLAVFIFVFSLRKGYIPVPPLFFGQYFSYVYVLFFGGLAIWASVMTMKKLDS